MPDNNPLNLTDVRDLAAETAVSENPVTPPPTEEQQTPTERPAYLALKFTFVPSRGDMGGAFCSIFEGSTGKTIFQVFWLAKPYAGKLLNEPSKEWRNFVKRFPQMGPLDKVWGDKLQLLLRELLPVDDRRKLFENYTRPRLRQIESQIRRGFEQVTQCVFSAATDAEPVSRYELERAKVLRPLNPTPQEKEQAEAEAKEKEREEKEKERAFLNGSQFEGTVIKCSPIVDPVKGKASSEIVPGDIIEVGIEGEGTSALIRKFLEENNQQPLFPVDEIEKRDGKTYIYVKISDEIKGLLTLNKDLMLRVKEQPVPIGQVMGLAALEDILFFGVLGAALVGLIFVIRYFFI